MYQENKDLPGRYRASPIKNNDGVDDRSYSCSSQLTIPFLWVALSCSIGTRKVSRKPATRKDDKFLNELVQTLHLREKRGTLKPQEENCQL